MKVVLSAASARQFDELPLKIRQRVASIFDRLRNWPVVSGAKPLRGNLTNHYRIRTGDYRVQFCVEDDRLIIEKIGHRDGFYEE